MWCSDPLETHRGFADEKQKNQLSEISAAFESSFSFSVCTLIMTETRNPLKPQKGTRKENVMIFFEKWKRSETRPPFIKKTELLNSNEETTTQDILSFTLFNIFTVNV